MSDILSPVPSTPEGSELRQDPVSGEWMLLAPTSGTRPSDFRKRDPRIVSDLATCPFEDPQKSGNADPILLYPSSKDWRLQVLPNKFPILNSDTTGKNTQMQGLYSVRAGEGYHDLLITRDHDATFAFLSEDEALLVFKGFQDRFLQIAEDARIQQIVMFQNWGPASGATIYHPHYQMVSLPIVPPEMQRSLENARAFSKTNTCIFCSLIEWEQKEKKRILFETEDVIVYAPFFSKEPFELRIYPKSHNPHFETASHEEQAIMVRALQHTLRILHKNLEDPDYNFFIHTAPIHQEGKEGGYHWHIEIIPRIGRGEEGGVELSMGMQVNRIDPIDAIQLLQR